MSAVILVVLSTFFPYICNKSISFRSLRTNIEEKKTHLQVLGDTDPPMILSYQLHSRLGARN
jgi:hypothetical protein